MESILDVITRYIPPPIEKTRRKQTLLALLNCTRKDLIPDPYLDLPLADQRKLWEAELQELESLP